MAAISTQMQGPKSLVFSFGDFDFMSTNHVATTHSKAMVSEDYYPIMDFLAQSPLDYALVHEPILFPAGVSEASTYVQVEKGKITLSLGSNSFDITSEVLNGALHFPSQKPFDDIHKMMKLKNYCDHSTIMIV